MVASQLDSLLIKFVKVVVEILYSSAIKIARSCKEGSGVAIGTSGTGLFGAIRAIPPKRMLAKTLGIVEFN